MCSGFTLQHTVEETYPRSPTLKPSSLSPVCDSILPFLSLNTLPLTKLQHSILQFSFGSPTTLSFSSAPPSSSSLPGGFHHAQSLSIFMSFTCQQRRECASSSPTKEKHPPVISENAAGRRGVGRRSTGGQRELDNTASGINREMREGDGKTRRRECVLTNPNFRRKLRV